VLCFTEDKRSCIAVFCKNWRLHARWLSVDEDISMDIISMDISMDIHGKYVNMDMDMDGKFHIHGKPGKSFIDPEARVIQTAEDEDLVIVTCTVSY